MKMFVFTLTIFWAFTFFYPCLPRWPPSAQWYVDCLCMLLRLFITFLYLMWMKVGQQKGAKVIQPEIMILRRKGDPCLQDLLGFLPFSVNCLLQFLFYLCLWVKFSISYQYSITTSHSHTRFRVGKKFCNFQRQGGIIHSFYPLGAGEGWRFLGVL